MRDDWKEVKLEELGTIGRGKSRHRPRNADFLFGDKYPFVQTADVKDAEYKITSYSQMYSDAGLSQSKLWNKGTLCITIAANIADAAILGLDACFPDSVVGFNSFDDKSDVRFVKYLFDLLQVKIKKISQGAAQDNLSLEKIRTLNFLVPENIETQKKIASILSAYDDLIENNLKRIKILEEMAQQTYEEWFVRMRFPGYETATINPATGLPEGWGKVKLGDLGEYLNGFAFKPSDFEDEGFPIIKIKEMKSGLADDTPRNIGIRVPSKYFVEKGDILFSWSASLEVVIWSFEKGFVNQHLFKVTPYEEYSKPFVFFSIKKSLDIFDGLTTGATMKHIKRKELDFILINKPTIEILDKFSSNVNPMFESILNLQSQIQRLREARDILLPRLMMGILDV